MKAQSPKTAPCLEDTVPAPATDCLYLLIRVLYSSSGINLQWINPLNT